MRIPPLLADFIHAKVCKPIYKKPLILPGPFFAFLHFSNKILVFYLEVKQSADMGNTWYFEP